MPGGPYLAAQVETAPPSSRDDFDDFYRAYYVRVLVLMRKHFPGCDSEDVAQETMTRCYAHFASFDTARDPWPWVSSVARNTAIDALRRNRRAPVEEMADTAAAYGHDSTYDALLTLERRRSLWNALRRLKPADRQLIEDHDIEGIACHEIAALRDLTPNALRQQLYRARRRLALELRRAGAAFGVFGTAARFKLARAARKLNDLSMAAGTASESAMGLVAAAAITTSAVVGLGSVVAPRTATVTPATAAADATAVVPHIAPRPDVVPYVAPSPATERTQRSTPHAGPTFVGPTDGPVIIYTSGDPLQNSEPNHQHVEAQTPNGPFQVFDHTGKRIPGWNVLCYFGLVECST